MSKSPKKSAKANLTVQMSADLCDALQDRALAEDRSVSAIVRLAVSEYLRRVEATCPSK